MNQGTKKALLLSSIGKLKNPCSNILPIEKNPSGSKGICIASSGMKPANSGSDPVTMSGIIAVAVSYSSCGCCSNGERGGKSVDVDELLVGTTDE